MTDKRRHPGRAAVRPGRPRRRARPWSRRPRPRALLARRRLGRVTARWARRPAVRRVAVALVLLALFIWPLPGLAADGTNRPAACQGCAGHTLRPPPLRWSIPLAGSWRAGTGSGGTGDGGTGPAAGQAYVAVGDGLAVVGTGLSLTAYQLSDHQQRWEATLGARPGTVVISVRAWPGVVTVGLLAPGGAKRSEAVIDAATGAQLHRYPAAVLGGAVAASTAATVVLGPSGLTSYDNASGRVRWQRPAAPGQSWRADGQTLYLAQSPGGALSSAPVTALKVINLATGYERTLGSPVGRPFSGSLALAADGTVLFASAAGVTAYSGSTGGVLWSRPGVVPEGTDPSKGLVYLTGAGGLLTGVDPVTGVAGATVPGTVVPGTGSVYVVRDGTAFGLNGGAGGVAWGYSVAAGRVTWNSATLPWPHFFADPSGLGGSAAASGGTVVIATCPHLNGSSHQCQDPELVMFAL